MKRALLFIYDTFADFEVTILLTCLKSKYRMDSFTVAKQLNPIQSCAGFQVLPNLTIEQVKPEDYDILIIPGGEPVSVLKNSQLHKIVQQFYSEGKTLAAICGGPAILGASGILDKVRYTASIDPEDSLYREVLVSGNQVNKHIVIDKNIITATGSNYLNFAETVLRKIGFYSEDMEDPLGYFRNPSMN
jgi:protein deglycase